MLIVRNMLFNTPRSLKELVNKSDFRDVVFCILVSLKMGFLDILKTSKTAEKLSFKIML